uniref:WAS/WASL-interacting protein family member 3-like isoform X2 n=1 Tax=Callithrix jacchus TaxID=9483 RepID=UPI0023DD3176|nr:WAS/WASL-interacting protein family member 3-like isoform X2 [Callithrix jacchus]
MHSLKRLSFALQANQSCSVCSVESPAIFPPGFLPTPQASCCPEKSPPSLLCSAQQQQAANHRSRKAHQASAYPELTRNPLSHLSSLPRDGQPILSSYDTPPALCPRPVHPPIKPSYPSCAVAASPDLLPFLACPLVPINLNSASNSRAVIWGRVPGRGLQGGRTYGAETRDGGSLAPPSDPLPPATSPALLQFGLSTPDQAGLKLTPQPLSLPGQ